METNNHLEKEFSRQLANLTTPQLAQAFNREVGNRGWTYARSVYLQELRRALQRAGVDISSVVNPLGGFNLSRKVYLEHNRLQPVNAEG